MKKFICLLLVINFHSLLFAQGKGADNLRKLFEIAKTDTAKVNLLYRLSDFYANESPNLDSALFYDAQGLELSKKTGYKVGEITGLSNISFEQAAYGNTQLARQSVYTGLAIRNKFDPQNLELQLMLYRRLARIYSESNPDSSIYYFTKVLQLARNLHLPSREAEASGGLGYELLFLGNYPQALKVTINAVQIADENKDTLLDAQMYKNLGNVYFFRNDIRRSIHYYDTAESLAGKVKNVNPETTFDLIYIAKARAYLKLNILDSALLYAKQCYEISKKGIDYSIMSRLLNILGNIYQEMGKDSIAFNYFRQGILYSLSHNSNTSAIQTYNSLAQYFYNQQNTDSCIFYAKKAVELIQSSGFLSDEPETYRILSNAYKTRRNVDSTFKYMQLMQASKDSLLGKDKVEQMKLIEFDEEQQKIQQQAVELAYKNKLKFYSLFVGIVALFLVAGLLWRSTRIKQKSYIQLKKQQEETEHQRKTAEQTLKKLQATQAQLIRSEKMASLGELTAGIAHEIQNPLNFVNNFSEVNKELIEEMKTELKAGNHDDAIAIANDIAENEQKINHHGKRADTIVKGMLQHSRSSSGQKEPTDINALAGEYLRLAYQGLRAKDNSFNATMKTDFDETLSADEAGIGKINVIPQDIGRVLLNLYNNAFYAVNEKKKQQGESYEPSVMVITKKNKDKILISIKDNGIGIPQKVIDKIFQPFFTTKPTGQGTGLGLSLSYDIIKAHGGELLVDTKDGEGAGFVIELPAE